MSDRETVANQPTPPILRHDDDVLYLIFHHLCAIYPTGADNKLGWAYATHVCSRWREFGLMGCAPLWAHSLCALPKAFPTFLERARDASLTITLTEPELSPENPTPLESAEFREGIVGILRRRPQQVQRAIFTFPDFFGTHSEDMNDTVVLRTEARGEQASLFCSAILNEFMGKTLLELRQLEMVYDMNWCEVQSTDLAGYTAFSAPRLISLKLFRQRIPFETIYDILRNTPLLESLEIQWTQEDGPAMLTDLPPHTKPLALPRLGDVSLGSPNLSFQHLYSFWHLVETRADVRLRFVGTVFTPEDIANFLVALAPQLQRASGDMLTVQWGFTPTGIEVMLSSSSSMRVDPRPCVGIVILNVRILPVGVAALIQHTFVMVDPARIRVLNFKLDARIEPETVVQLARLTTLEELHVEFFPNGALGLLNSLSHPDPAAPPLFPALKTLVLKRINSEGDTAWRVQGRILVGAFLQQRIELGVPISTVVLRGMKMSSASNLDGIDEDMVMSEIEEHVDAVVDLRRDRTEGVMEIIADEDFL